MLSVLLSVTAFSCFFSFSLQQSRLNFNAATKPMATMAAQGGFLLFIYFFHKGDIRAIMRCVVELECKERRRLDGRRQREKPRKKGFREMKAH